MVPSGPADVSAVARWIVSSVPIDIGIGSLARLVAEREGFVPSCCGESRAPASRRLAPQRSEAKFGGERGIRAENGERERAGRSLKTARPAERSEAKFGGERGIRTLGRVSPTHAFQACSLNRSDISPL